MKVCYVTHKPNLTGANRSLLDLLDGLDRDRYEPVVLVNRRGPLLAELKKREIPYKYALIPPTLNSDNPVLDFLKRVLNSVPVNRLCVETVKFRLKGIRPDLVHNNSLLCSVGMQAARELKLPYLCHFRDFLWEDHHRKLLRPKRVHKLMDDADVCISISDTVKEKFQPFVTKDVVVIQDGIHTELYDLPVRPVLKGQEVNLLMAGRLHPGKGQLDAVKAVELARQKTDRDLKLHILGTVGDPAYAEELHHYVDSRHLDFVSIEDFVNDLSALREVCDIGLTCSYSEGLGRVTIENMLASLLVIASDSGGTLEIVTDKENGIYYKTGDPADLAEKILWALDHPDECMPIIEEGHRFAKETYDCRTYTAKVQKLYEQVLKNH